MLERELSTRELLLILVLIAVVLLLSMLGLTPEDTSARRTQYAQLNRAFGRVVEGVAERVSEDGVVEPDALRSVVAGLPDEIGRGLVVNPSLALWRKAGGQRDLEGRDAIALAVRREGSAGEWAVMTFNLRFYVLPDFVIPDWNEAASEAVDSKSEAGVAGADT